MTPRRRRPALDDVATLRRVTALVERYQALVEQIPAVLYINLPDETATTIYVSPQTETILHIPAEAWSQDLDWLDYLHPAEQRTVLLLSLSQISWRFAHPRQ